MRLIRVAGRATFRVAGDVRETPWQPVALEAPGLYVYGFRFRFVSNVTAEQLAKIHAHGAVEVNLDGLLWWQASLAYVPASKNYDVTLDGEPLRLERSEDMVARLVFEDLHGDPWSSFPGEATVELVTDGTAWVP